MATFVHKHNLYNEELLSNGSQKLIQLVDDSCRSLITKIFPAADTELLNFKHPLLSVDNIQTLIDTYGTSRFREYFCELVGKFDVNSDLSPTVCKWLNDPGKNCLINLPGPCGRHRKCWTFQSGSSTLFSLVMWIGDTFCVKLALALCAKADVLNNDTNLDADYLVSSPVVQQLLQKQEWDLRLIRALDVCDQEYSGTSFIGRGDFADVFKASFKGNPCAIKRFSVPFTETPLEFVEEMLREMQCLQQFNHPNIVQCFCAFVWDPQFPTTNSCLLLELMDLNLEMILCPGAATNESVSKHPNGT